MKLLEEQRERLQIDDIRTILCIALGEHSRLADDVTADLMNALSDSPVLMTSSTMRIRLPFSIAQSSSERYSVWMWSVVMDFTSTLIGFVMYALMPLRATTY